jgi:prophage antirepressor-like protein
MSSQQIIPFSFEEHQIRVVTGNDGEPWFNANDVCAALEMGNPSQALKSHVDDDDLQKLEVIDNLGRLQQANHVNESGLYALIFGSTKEAAKRFKHWVTHEVLPTLRKTGAYSLNSPLHAPTEDRVGALLLIGERMAKVPGVKPGIMAAAVLACIQTNTGLTTEEIRRALPASNEPIGSCNATKIGELLGVSARKANSLLAEQGLQIKNARGEWELTEQGTTLGEAIPFSQNGHSGYQILWNPAVADELREAA